MTTTLEAFRTSETGLTAERAYIGSCLLDAEQFYATGGILMAESFYDPVAQAAFQAIGQLLEAGTGIDTLIVADRVSALLGSETGVAVWILEAFEAVPHGMHAREYAETVRENWKRRQMAESAADLLRQARDPSIEPDAALARHQSRVARLSEAGVIHQSPSWSELLMTSLDEITSDSRKRTPTGFEGLDNRIGGFRPGQLIVVAARPGMGKSAFAQCCAENGVERDIPALFLSLEMAAGELACRTLIRLSGLRKHELENPSPTVRTRLADLAAQIQRWPLIVEDRTHALEDCVRSIRTARRKKGIEVAYVDYLGLIVAPDQRPSPVQQIATITRRLKQLAQEQQIPIVLLCQLSRAVEQRSVKIPILSDLRDSGAIEQDADVVMFLHRPGYYDRGITDDRATVVVAKQRSGPIGSVELQWDGARTAFRNINGPSDAFEESNPRSAGGGP